MVEITAEQFLDVSSLNEIHIEGYVVKDELFISDDSIHLNYLGVLIFIVFLYPFLTLLYHIDMIARHYIASLRYEYLPYNKADRMRYNQVMKELSEMLGNKVI